MEYVDPVCGMRVDPSKSKHKTLYKGRIYYFCSSRCKEEFERNPEYYLSHGPRGMPG
ncbi:YHS domain-containing protein [Desulfurococcus mucosus]|uniref:YHS domain-containing protein n=1 Tax=Desulfurococcus mucosus (strain ATCC 35584 / DSM 2162 / JCM 9187 / O7/1) TaxID=765177 RepID=E8R6Y3_DESM0|nr:YHS domain-containing protein [Desulfurococcus mucosus]ADV64416.1 YHS domain-containing protein [Desulfurococcus mucosus DSM 2162]